jgi:hypothetical protein
METREQVLGYFERLHHMTEQLLPWEAKTLPSNISVEDFLQFITQRVNELRSLRERISQLRSQ